MNPDPFHPVLGSCARAADGGVHPVYTRTIVLWAVGITLDPDRLWETVEVRNTNDNRVVTHADDIVAVAGVAAMAPPRLRGGLAAARRAAQIWRGARRPVVRMATAAHQRRGNLAKRLRRAQSFRSVLSLDVECAGYMPNLKISRRNTIQATGVQDLGVLGAILRHLVERYRGRGVEIVGDPAAAGFVGDVVLANLQFRLDWPVSRVRLRDAVNALGGPFLASYEPVVRDVSVSLKHADAAPLPLNGAVLPRWTLCDNAWTTVTHAAARKLAPRINAPGCAEGVVRVTSLRVFASGCVVVIGRWPGDMAHVYDKLVRCAAGLRASIVAPSHARQRTLESCWRVSGTVG